MSKWNYMTEENKDQHSFLPRNIFSRSTVVNIMHYVYNLLL